MKAVYLSEWHMIKLIEHLSSFLHSGCRIVPALQNTGIKVFSQWRTIHAQFYFSSKDMVHVKLSMGWNDVNRSALVTAILRTFRWDYVPPRQPTWCCPAWYKPTARTLVFKL